MTNLSTILSESAREFDEKVNKWGGGPLAAVLNSEYDSIRDFLLSKQRAVIESVIAEADGMKYKEHRMEKHMDAYVGGYDQALSDLISRLKESLTTTRAYESLRP